MMVPFDMSKAYNGPAATYMTPAGLSVGDDPILPEDGREVFQRRLPVLPFRATITEVTVFCPITIPTYTVPSSPTDGDEYCGLK